MSGGYVLNFSDRTFEEFVFDTISLKIHDQKYCSNGTSKAKKLRKFWEIENDYLVGRLLDRLIEHGAENQEDSQLSDRCRQIVARLLAGGPELTQVKTLAEQLNAKYLKEQIRRLEESVQKDPSLAIGTAKEMIETYCKTILAERGKNIQGTQDLMTLTKQTFKELNLIPANVPDTAKGAEIIRRILSNLSMIGQGIAELRNLYGTGHGREGKSIGLTARHAKLAVGAAVTLVVFLYETHQETKLSSHEKNLR
jgi:hypothetical protein